MSSGARAVVPSGRARSRPGFVAVLALAAIVNVAAIYLAQPLLPFIGDSLDASPGAMSVVQAGIQIAFGTGLVVFGILADITDRRGLLLGMCLGLLAFAALAAASGAYGVFLVASLGIGLSAAVLPVAIATAAAARDPRALAAILSGAPAGIVIGRLVAGAAGEVSWRLAFAAAALAAAAMLVCLRALLDPDPPLGAPAPFRRGLLQMGGLVRIPGNMLINASNAAVFVGWSAVWTMLAFHLDREFALGAFAIGLVGLAGAGGAISGQVGAWLQVRAGEHGAAALSLVIGAVGSVAIALSGASLAVLVVALFVHNAGVWLLQAVNVPAAARRAGPTRAARGSALLYLGNFIATAVGAVMGAAVWEAFGWSAVGWLACGAIVASLALELAGRGYRATGMPAGLKSEV